MAPGCVNCCLPVLLLWVLWLVTNHVDTLLIWDRQTLILSQRMTKFGVGGQNAVPPLVLSKIPPHLPGGSSPSATGSAADCWWNWKPIWPCFPGPTGGFLWHSGQSQPSVLSHLLWNGLPMADWNLAAGCWVKLFFKTFTVWLLVF